MVIGSEAGYCTVGKHQLLVLYSGMDPESHALHAVTCFLSPFSVLVSGFLRNLIISTHCTVGPIMQI
jgi:hypothetical protein